MRYLHTSVTTVALLFTLMGTGTVVARDRWTPEQANAWYARQPWIVGANYIPATAINQLEMWQAETFDPARIDRELGWAESIGMNAMRVFLHDLLWKQDAAGFKSRMNRFLEISARHHIRILFVLFDSCWEPNPKLGPQHPPIPGVHNSGWVQSPGQPALADVTQEARLEAYVKGVIGAFAQDNRIIAWDLWNEPEDVASSKRIEQLLPKVFGWARSANPTQPLTSPVFETQPLSSSALEKKQGWEVGKPTRIEQTQLSESDVISFHDYHWPEVFMVRLKRLLPLGRPVWCTEYLARGAGSTIEGVVPIGKRHNVAMFNWGLVDGKTQARLPWDSWSIPYFEGRQPIVWHHDLFHADGTPYRTAEVDFLHAIAKVPKGVVPPFPDIPRGD